MDNLKVMPYIANTVGIFEDEYTVQMMHMTFGKPDTIEKLIELVLKHSLIYNLPLSDKLKMLLAYTYVDYMGTESVSELLDLYFNTSGLDIVREFNNIPLYTKSIVL